MEEAVAVGARSIAFPAISTGVFGYPADEAAAVAVATTTAAHDLDLDRVVLVAFDEATRRRYERLLG
jgi:O-acetyl-ADP-ribose deacetylase (regulator of RNase III)